MPRPVIHLYCLCWNESRIIPAFLSHYDFVDQFFIFDNGSTDNSLALLRERPNVTVEHFDTVDSFVLTEKRISDTAWAQSVGVADWVIMIDMDEFLVHPDLPAFLDGCTGRGVTAVEAITYEMVCGRPPDRDRSLVRQEVKGVRSPDEKLCIFNPNAVTSTNFGVGRHLSEPEGAVYDPNGPSLLMLHYKRLGLTYYIARSRLLATGLTPLDIQQSFATHYLWSPQRIMAEYRALHLRKAPVAALADAGSFAAFFDNEARMRASDLFDGDWYLETYPDVRSAHIRPMAHFLANGWYEGREPRRESGFGGFRQCHSPPVRGLEHPFLSYILATA